jgi:hypothetical protein
MPASPPMLIESFRPSISFIQSPDFDPAGKELGKLDTYLVYLAFMGMAHLGHISGSPFL